MKQVRNLGVGKGFKKTEIGEIPADWEVTRLGDICEVVGGGTPSTKKKEYWDGDIPWATPTDITALKLNTIENTEKTITKEGLSNSSAKLLPVGSILLTSRATIGECAINSVPMATNQGFANLVCKKVLSGYVFQYLRFIRQTLVGLASGSTFKEISKKSIRSLTIPFPPLGEQKRIGEVISVMDDAFQKLSEVIEKTKQLKKAMMRRLLTQGIGHTKFKKTEIDKIPSEWEVVRVADVCAKPEYGYTASASSSPTGPKFLRITDIQDGQVRWEDVPYCSCAEDAKRKYSLKEGDIVFARTGASTGKSFLISKCPDAVFASYLIKISARDVDPLFLYLFFQSLTYWKQVEQLMVGSAQGGLNATQLSRIRLPLPPFAEQRHISSILSSIDDELDQALKCRAKLGELKKALMRVLLTGKVRVKV